ncbi:MAG: hypothetical protein WBV25_11050, partial [Methylocella sp.]
IKMTKCQLSFTTIWLALAITTLAFATVGHPLSFAVHHFNLASIAEASVYPKNHSACGNGVSGQYSKIHGGFVCSTELTPAP